MTIAVDLGRKATKNKKTKKKIRRQISGFRVAVGRLSVQHCKIALRYHMVPGLKLIFQHVSFSCDFCAIFVGHKTAARHARLLQST